MAKIEQLLAAAQERLIPFIQNADNKNTARNNGRSSSKVAYYPPEQLSQLLNLSLPAHGLGKDGMLQVLENLLEFSVNTWDQGYMDKLASGTNAVSRIL